MMQDAPYPDGTRLQGPGGMYVVRGGVPVLEGQAAAPQAPGIIRGAPKMPDALELSRENRAVRSDARAEEAAARAARAEERRNALDTQRLQMDASKEARGTVEQEVKGGFYSRAIKANKLYEDMGVGAPSMGRSVAQAILPDAVVNAWTDPARQQADTFQRDFVMATLRAESGAALPPQEIESQIKTYFPVTGDTPETIAAKRQLRQNAIAALQGQAGPAATKYDQALAQQPQAAPTVNPNALPQEEVNKRIGQMLVQGATADQIMAFARENNVDIPDRAMLERGVQQRGGAVVSGQPDITSAPDVSGRDGLLGAVDAVGRGAADTATFGFADELAAAANTVLPLDRIVGGNDQVVSMWDGLSPQQAYARNLELQRAVDQQDEAVNPVSRFGGQFAGGALMGGAIAARAPGAVAAMSGGTRAARIAKAGGVAAAAGGAYGAGSAPEGERVAGAANGALTAPIAAAVGTGVAKGAGRVLAPVVDPAVARLRDAGVKLTTGQALGGAFNRAEAKLQALPIVGDMIRSARRRSLATYNTAAFNEALQPLGKTLPKGVEGVRAHAFAQRQFADAYDEARAGMRFNVDDEFKAGLASLNETVSGGGLDDAGIRRLNTIFKSKVARRVAQGGQEGVDGNTYKRIVSDLGQIARNNAVKDPELASAVSELSSLVDQAARRVSDPAAAAKLAKADEGYAKFVRIEGASARAGGGPGEFTPAQLRAEVQRQSGTKRSREYLRGDALMQELADAGVDVLPENIPDSGTPERLLMNAGVLGGGLVTNPSALAAYAGLGVPYAPGVRDVAVNALIGRRPELVQRLGEISQRNALLLGAGAAPVAISGTSR